MFSIRSRVASMLQPWLVAEPDLEVKLGFLRSYGCTKNLLFEVSVLNQLIDESSCWCFKNVNVESLSIRFSPWSVPSFTVDVRGVHVTLILREPVDGDCSISTRSSVDWSEVEKKKILADIDPEGTALHDIIEKISSTSSGKAGLRTSFLNVILRNCKLQMHDTRLEVQLPAKYGSVACLAKVKELSLEGLHLGNGCLLGGLVYALFVPEKETSLVIKSSGLEIDLKRDEDANSIFSSSDFFASIELNDLQLMNLKIRAVQLDFAFCPVNLQTLLVFSILSSKKINYHRDGRELWNIIRRRLGSLALNPRLSLHKAVVTVGLWLRHIHAYESLLLLVGYSAQPVFRKTALRISQDRKLLDRIRHRSKEISEIEKGLPVEALAQARRVARYRVTRHAQHSQRKNPEPLGDVHKTFIWKVLSLLLFFSNRVYRILGSCFLFVGKMLNRRLEKDGSSGAVSEYFLLPYCFSLELGQISISIYPINEIRTSVRGKPESPLSFCMVVDALFLIYTGDNTSHSLSLSMGDFKVHTSSSSLASLRGTSSTDDSSYSSRGRKKEKVHDSKAVVWSEPASQFLLPEKVAMDSCNSANNAWFLHLENYLEQMWSNWKRIRKKLELSKAQHSEAPFILCEINFSAMDPYPCVPDCAVRRCCLTLGKLNFDLGYSSIMSVVLLLRQIQHALYWTAIGSTCVSPNSPSIIVEPSKVKLEDYYVSYTNGIKIAMIRLLQEKNMQVGVALAGPTVRISLHEALLRSKEQDNDHTFSQVHGRFDLVFDLENIELVVWPAGEKAMASFTGEPRLDEAGREPVLVEDPEIINILGDLSNKYISEGLISLDSCLKLNGLNVYFEDLEENRQCQAIVLKSILLRSSFCKKYHHSLAISVSTLLTHVSGMANGIAVISYMDELFAVLQVFGYVLSTMSYEHTSLGSRDWVRFQDLLWQNNFSSKQDPDMLKQEYGAKAAALVLKSTSFTAEATFEFGPFDIILHKSRQIHILDNYIKLYGASGNNLFARYEHGIGVSIKHSRLQISSTAESVRVINDTLGIQSAIFRGQNLTGDCSCDQLIDLVRQSSNCVCEFTLPTCTLDSSFISPGNTSSSGCVNEAVDGSTSGTKSSAAAEDLPSVNSDGSDIPSCGVNGQLISTIIPAVPSTYQVLINVALGEIFMAMHTTKKALSAAHQPKRLLSSASIGGEFRTISWTVEGGLIVLDTSALAMFLNCFDVYLLYLKHLSSIIPSREQVSPGRQFETVKLGERMSRLSNHPSQRSSQRTISSFSLSEPCNVRPESKCQLLMIRLTQFSLALVTDDCGGIWEILFEFDFHLKLELINLRRKFLFDHSRMTILSHRLHDNCANLTKNDIPGHAYSSGSLASSTMDSDVSIYSRSDPRNCILKHAAVFLAAENAITRNEVVNLWVKNDWVGTGSVSGLDFTISLSELQMILSLLEPLSGISNVEPTVDSEEKQRPSNQISNTGSEDTVPDGAIVAIQDVHQHMYFAVDYSEDKYRLVGTMHYSIAGERALFRVKYCSRKRWGVTVQWFTLMSLHAKSTSGESLFLNYNRGSAFVDISSTDDNDWALWKSLSYKPENYEGDSDLESYNQFSKNTFHLLNKKCDFAVAFVDGVPEFVKKPGNPFKMKVFHNFCLADNPLKPVNPSAVDCEMELQGSNVDEGKKSIWKINLPYVNVTIDKVNLTIVHEVPNGNDRFPLLQSCISEIKFMVQVLSSKVRLISTFTAAVSHFDAQNNLWKEIVQPVEMCIYYRSRFTPHNLDMVSQGIPVSFYFRIKQVDVFLTEVSLDILLFMVGELKFAGPYAVRSSTIFANCCKVENQSGLSLLCHIDDKQDVAIPGRQSASIFLRRAALASKDRDNTSFVSVQLAVLGTFSTSPIQVSLLESRMLSWRTRVVSLQDSKTSPGPFIVVEISKKSEDGLSIVVSPLLRIHNETGFSMNLRFRRPQQETESAVIMLRAGDVIDDSMAALEAINSSGGLRKALMSLSLGNFIFSFRPIVTELSGNSRGPVSIKWSEDLKGGKAIRLSGIFDKLSYRFKRAFGAESLKYSFSSVQCSLTVEGEHLTDLHFLIQTIGRDVPVIKPDNLGSTDVKRPSPVAVQEQKEIFLLPTVRVYNFLKSEIHVLVTETHPDQCTYRDGNHTGKEATVPCGSSASLYGNPTMMYFTVTLTAFDSRCKSVSSADWVKKLHKQKSSVQYLDIDLDFGGGKYFASLRLQRGDRGILEAAVFTSYTLQNDSDLAIFCFTSNQKPLSRVEADKFGGNIPLERGSLLPPKSSKSWFLKSNKVQLILLEEKASAALLDLDALSRFTEINLEVDEGNGVKHMTKLGVSLIPCHTDVIVPSQTVALVPRYVISNESQASITVRQCYLQDDRDGSIAVNSKQKVALHLKSGPSKKKEVGFFDSFVRKHKNTNEDSLMFIQFCLNEIGWSWSGPICVASIGRFFLKFRRPLGSLGQQSNPNTGQENKLTEFAVVHVVEDGPTLVLHFHRPPSISLPYRIENFLRDAVTYYQKDYTESDVLASGSSVNYVWEDLNLPHKLVAHIPGLHISREINMDKVCGWKPFSKVRQNRGLAMHLPLDKKSGDRTRTMDGSQGLEILKLGYEVYADGSTRVLRMSEFSNSSKEDRVFQPCTKIRLRVLYFSIHLLEHGKQDEGINELTRYSPLIVARLGNINLDSLFTDTNKYNQIVLQSLDVDEKWEGAPFASMLRKNQLDYSDTKANILHIYVTLLSTDSNVKQVTYSSIILQPINLNLDEETLMRLVPFWRTSLSDTNTQSRQFYFEHFEIHPVKIIASFLPGGSDSSYSSAQETLRSLLHSVIKIPTVKNMDVELNGILVTHALVTVRELFIKCAQHYSWYSMRAIYIAKGSPLLPPSFASIFDDSASSSLDVFFDPSSGLVNLPGLTLGMFKYISKCVNKKGVSGTKRYFGDLGKTVRTAGSNILFAAVTEISDCILRGAEANGFNGMMNGFNQGILKLAMEPSLLGTAVMEGGPDRKIKLDRSPGIDELYIEGYLQAMLDSIYKQEYLRVRVIDNQVVLKNLPPSTSLIDEIMERVKSFLISKTLLKGELPANSRSLHHLRGENEWKIGPTLLTLWEHLFVSFSIRMLRKQACKVIADVREKAKSEDNGMALVLASTSKKLHMKWGIGKFIFSGLVAYVDGRLCRRIPNPIVRRIVSGFLLSFLDKTDS